MLPRQFAPSALSPFLLTLTLSALLGGSIRAQEAPAYVSPSEARLKADVGFLADDLREGRGPGTNGINAAADYIAASFRNAGLKTAPGADGYFQNFTIAGTASLKDGTSLAINGPDDLKITPELRKQYSPLSLGGSGSVESAPLVFAGYGITAKDEDLKLDYDDYKDVDVKDKAVLIIRREPQGDKEDSPFAGKNTTTYATFRHKARNAADHGAALVLLVNDASMNDDDQLLEFSSAGGNGSGVPFIMLTRATADEILAKAGAPKLAELEAQIDENLQPVSRELEGFAVAANVEVDRDPIAVKNVIAVLEGEGPFADETIVIGAHYDHLGRGGSGSLMFGSSDIHNGADDNASGTSLVMELARRLADRKDPLPRRIVFMAFSAEERGLLGSRHYVDNPLYPLADTVAMINFDMVGRLNDSNELILFGTGSTPGLEALAGSLAQSQGFSANIVKGRQMQFDASDHASFYNKDIPVLFAFTGIHPDYHRPSDDSDLINYDGMEKVANFGELVALDFANRPVRPEFVKLETPAAGPVTRREGGTAMPYMGTRPAYGESDTPGVKLDGVSENSPAEKAGLKEGDTIVKFAGDTITDIEDFMESLGRKKAGDTVEVVVKRGDKEETLSVILGTRAGQQ